MLTSLVRVLFTFYIHGVLKLKKNNSGAKGLSRLRLSPLALRTQNNSLILRIQFT